MARRTPAASAAPPVLGLRALGRALLARQMLLARDVDRSVPDAVHHLVGLQAQTPRSPYVALWSRLAGFDPGELGDLLTGRRVVRIALMRSTIHLVSADDCLFLRPLLAGFLARALDRSGWSRGMAGLDLPAVAGAARELVDAEPLTWRELGAAWPNAGPTATRRPWPRWRGRTCRWSRSRPGACGAGRAWPGTRPPNTGWGGRSKAGRRSPTWCCATWRRSGRRR